MPPRRTSYSVKEKLRAVARADGSNNCVAAREFSVSEKLIRDWRKAKDAGKFEDALRTRKKIGSGRKSFHPILERELVDWVLTRRQSGLTVSTFDIRRKAKSLGQEPRHATEHFQFSSHWCFRFMKRHKLVMRERTTLAARLPEDLTDKVLSFQRFIIDRRQEHPLELAQIGNMDEVPLTFDMPTKKTVNERGAHSILVRTTGHEKSHFTVALACMADGTKLPPYVILKRKTLPRCNIPAGVILRVQAKGWMDAAGMVDWVSSVWNRRPGALRQPHSLLVMDSFAGHKDNLVKTRLQQRNTAIAMIPGGLTSICQPLDVSLNKPFKQGIKTRWVQWMETGEHTFTPSGRQRAATPDLLCQWVKESWDDVKVEIVTKSFRKCGISNALDGTEDDEIFADDNEPELPSESESDSDDNDDGNDDSDDGDDGSDGDDNGTDFSDEDDDDDEEDGYETDDAR